MDDVRAVMDAVGSERAVLYGVSESGPLACLFAATYPERTTGLVLYSAYASEVRQPDYPWRSTAEEYAAYVDASARTIHETWGNTDSPVFDRLITQLAPSGAGDPAFRTWFATSLRLGASPGAAIALQRMDASIDVRHVLPTIQAPTLILHRTGCFQDVEENRYLATHIPGARLVEVPGIDYLPFVGDVDPLIDEIETFVTGVRPVAVSNRMLATILVIEVQGTAGDAISLGDRRWGDLQDRFQKLSGRELDRFQGRALELTSNRVVATFDGPARAIWCARAIVDAMREIGVATRAGMHTGECEVRDGHVTGVAIPLAAWVASQAAANEILVTGTVKDLVTGAQLAFADRGARTPSDATGEWRLFALLPDAASSAESTAGAMLGPIRRPLADLTRREREVLPLVALGLSNRQIADALSIGERTVESHVANILAKWGLANRAQIAVATLRDGDLADPFSHR